MYALVDCNNFYASCERVFDPKLRNRPIVILSNNDGCIISRSQEAKDAGFPMGAPIFQEAERIRKHKATVMSSNYVLYGDMSRRVMEVLQCFASQSEVYSIDESFLLWDKVPKKLMDYGAKIKQTVYQWTGIPVSVGFGVTKTLAKSASKLAKKNDGVYWLRSDDRDTLEALPASSIWGIGKRSAVKLANMGIHTVHDLQQAPDDAIKKVLSVNGQRTVLELRGTPCIELEEIAPTKKEICCSRSFGKMLTTKQDIREAVASFATRAAEKLRRGGSVTGVVHVFLETNGHRQDLAQYVNAATVGLPIATAYTPNIVQAAMRCVNDIYREGFRYKRAGVLLLDLCPKDSVQQELFTPDSTRPQHEALMFALDRINSRFGINTLASASIGVKQAHKMNQQNLSPRYTTRWEDVFKITLPDAPSQVTD